MRDSDVKAELNTTVPLLDTALVAASLQETLLIVRVLRDAVRLCRWGISPSQDPYIHTQGNADKRGKPFMPRPGLETTIPLRDRHSILTVLNYLSIIVLKVITSKNKLLTHRDHSSSWFNLDKSSIKFSTWSVSK
jgi:hypothetical protein